MAVKAWAARATAIKEDFMMKVDSMWRMNLGRCCLNGDLELGNVRSSRFIHPQEPYSPTLGRKFLALAASPQQTDCHLRNVGLGSCFLGPSALSLSEFLSIHVPSRENDDQI